jgi:hypothetical protein
VKVEIERGAMRQTGSFDLHQPGFHETQAGLWSIREE